MAHPEFDWILKPHPILKKHCISENIMKAEEIEKYFDDWNNLPNAKVVEGGEYLDIFKTSDAIILDSISFIAEYMVTGKPILFTCKHKTILDTEFNEFGVELAKNLYKAHRWSDITSFIKTVVSEGKDTLIQHRMDFINETLRHNENAAAETIIKCIKDALI
jgi:CDP-glycerol glycerophosphotransferase (TagB/SpsB family)